MNPTHGMVVREPEGSVPGVVRLGTFSPDLPPGPDWIPLCHWKAEAAHAHWIDDNPGVHLHVCDIHARCIPNGTYEIEGLASVVVSAIENIKRGLSWAWMTERPPTVAELTEKLERSENLADQLAAALRATRAVGAESVNRHRLAVAALAAWEEARR